MRSSENISEIPQQMGDSAGKVILVFLAFSCLWFLWNSFRNDFVYHLQWLETWCCSVWFRIWSIKDSSGRGFLWVRWWWLTISQTWVRPPTLSPVATDLTGSSRLSLLALHGWEWGFSWLRVLGASPSGIGFLTLQPSNGPNGPFPKLFSVAHLEWVSAWTSLI